MEEQRFIHKNGNISKKGTVQPTITPELFDRVRKRMKKTKEELPDRKIKQIIIASNQEIANWIVDNPEGFELYSKFGYLVASKHLPKEFRTDKEEKIALIKSLDISEACRLRYLNRYDVDIGRRIDQGKFNQLKELIPQLNLHSFFYVYKIMWFNHRNCDFFKSQCYRFDAARGAKTTPKAMLFDKIMQGVDFYCWNFHDFYRSKLHLNEE
jgi:hypothetical protein